MRISKYTLILIAACGIVMTTTHAHAEDTPTGTGNQLLAQCKTAINMIDSNAAGTANDNFDAGYCLGTVRAMGAVLMTAGLVCGTDNVTVAQEMRIVIKYLQDNPSLLNQDDTGLAEVALMAAFPCANKGTKSSYYKN